MFCEELSKLRIKNEELRKSLAELAIFLIKDTSFCEKKEHIAERGGTFSL